jgi:hypothetical protein
MPLALVASSCLDMKQDIWINPDGTGRLRIDVGVSKSVMDSPDAETGESDLSEDFRQVQRDLKDDPRIRSLHTEGYATSEYVRAAIDLVVHDWRDLPDVNGLVIDRQEGEGGTSMNAYLIFTLSEEEDGTIHYVQPAGGTSSEPSGPDEEGFGESIERAMAEAMFREGALSVTLHSPTISRTSGTWQLDKSSVGWSMEMSEAMINPPAEGAFTAEIGPSARSSHFWRTVGIILAVSALVGLLAWFRHDRGGQEAPPEPVR